MEIFIRGLVALGIALAVAAYGFSDTVQAPPAAVGVQPGTAGCGDSGSGWAPHIKHVFGFAHTHSWGHGHEATPLPAHTPAPRTQPGTVVFPQSPFTRSPRDFFMVD